MRFQLNKDAFDCPQLLPPVYLSYSKTLIEDAKKLSQTLFDKNNVYKEIMKKHSVSYKKDIQPSLKNMFYVFKDLLKSASKIMIKKSWKQSSQMKSTYLLLFLRKMVRTIRERS